MNFIRSIQIDAKVLIQMSGRIASRIKWFSTPNCTVVARNLKHETTTSTLRLANTIVLEIRLQNPPDSKMQLSATVRMEFDSPQNHSVEA